MSKHKLIGPFLSEVKFLTDYSFLLFMHQIPKPWPHSVVWSKLFSFHFHFNVFSVHLSMEKSFLIHRPQLEYRPGTDQKYQ